MQRRRFTRTVQSFLALLDSESGRDVGFDISEYSPHHIRPCIFLGDRKSFFLEPSRFVHRGYFRLTERNFRLTGSTSL